MAVTQGVFGAANDKTIIKFDGFVNQVKINPLFTQFKYNLYTNDSSIIEEKGVHLIVDGGLLYSLLNNNK